MFIWDYEIFCSELSSEIVSVLGAKNVLPINHDYQTSYNGVTITNNNDGTFLLNGTCNADASLSLHNVDDTDFLAKVGKANYILSGYPSISGNTGKTVFHYRKTDDSDWADSYSDKGQGVTLSYDGTKTKYTIYFLIKAGDSFNNVIYKPMIRLASIQDDTYVPYSMTNRELTNRTSFNTNLLDNPWFTVNQRGEISSYFADRWRRYASELTFTNNDGVTISGTPSSIENLGEQMIEWDRLKNHIGKPITLSVLINGTIYKAVGKINTPTSSWKSHATLEIPSLNIWFQLLTNGTSPSVAELYIKNITTDPINVTIHAVKLELGSVSTIAMDTVSNYAEELLKCQRYFKRLLIGERLGRINNGGTAIRFGITEVEDMVSIKEIHNVKTEQSLGVTISGAGVQFWLEFETDYTLAVDKKGGIRFDLTTAGQSKVVNYINQVVGMWNYTYYIDISADL